MHTLKNRGTYRHKTHLSFSVPQVKGYNHAVGSDGRWLIDLTNTADNGRLTGLGADYALSKRKVVKD
jgi:hypothetical protein